MKRACWILIVFMSAIASRAQTTQKVYLVEVTEPTREKTQQVVTVEMYQSLQAEMTAKNHLLAKALDLAEREWKEKHADAGPFPRHAASQGQVKSLGMFSDRAKAEQELKDIQAREDQQQEKKLSSAEKQVEPLRKQLENLNGIQNRTAAQQTQLVAVQNNIKVLDDQIARQKKKEEDKNANLAIARELIKGKLRQLPAEQNGDNSSRDGQVPR